MKKTVAIIGAGEIGQAIAELVSRKKISTRLWDVDAKKVPKMKPLQETLAGAVAVFLCVPSWAIRPAVKSIHLFLPKSAVVVVLSKGVEEKSLKTMAELLPALLPRRQKWALLSGPMLAEELQQGLPGAGVVATSSRYAFQTVAELFKHTQLLVTWCPDPKAIAWAGILKNVYAMGLGIADGLGWGWNTKGYLASRSIEEMHGILRALGFPSPHAVDVAGVADLLATGFSPDSRNRTFGKEIITKGTCQFRGEGCVSLPSLLKRLGMPKARKFPILLALSSVVTDHANASHAFQKLFTQNA